MNFKEAVKPNRQWFTIVLFGLLMLVGGVGTCTKTMGPIVDPAPAPAPGPLPGPNQYPTPNDVWQVLDPPSSHKVKGLELPPPIQISADRKFIIVAAKCEGPVRWLISAQSGTVVEALESKLTNSILIFTTGKPNDKILVLAYSVLDGLPTDTAITLISIEGGVPTPGPDPMPEPAAKLPKKLHVTFLLDFDKKTRAVSEIVDNQELRQWLENQGHKLHEVSIKDVSKYNLESYIEDKAPPLLILQAQAESGIKEGAKVLDGVTQLYSVQAVKDAVLKATGKKE